MPYPPVPVEQANRFLLFSSTEDHLGALAPGRQTLVQQVVGNLALFTRPAQATQNRGKSSATFL